MQHLFRRYLAQYVFQRSSLLGVAWAIVLNSGVPMKVGGSRDRLRVRLSALDLFLPSRLCSFMWVFCSPDTLAKLDR